MHVSYFGSSERPLLGLYHPPEDAGRRNAAVVLCPPGPQEYMQSHWALRKLAARLAGAGFHVLRFDYYGTGDSGGSSDAGTLEQWREDVASAMEELQAVTAIRRASVVGFRLGATLAAQAEIRVRDLVLWEPVVSGAEYLEELRLSHIRRFSPGLHPPPLPRRGPLHEVLGCPLPPTMEDGLKGLELGTPMTCRAERVAVVTSETRPSYRALVDRLLASGVPTTDEVFPEPTNGDEPFLLSSGVQKRIAELLSKGRS